MKVLESGGEINLLEWQRSPKDLNTDGFLK